jgi:hypothetical protein
LATSVSARSYPIRPRFEGVPDRMRVYTLPVHIWSGGK